MQSVLLDKFVILYLYKDFRDGAWGVHLVFQISKNALANPGFLRQI